MVFTKLQYYIETRQQNPDIKIYHNYWYQYPLETNSYATTDKLDQENAIKTVKKILMGIASANNMWSEELE